MLLTEMSRLCDGGLMRGMPLDMMRLRLSAAQWVQIRDCCEGSSGPDDSSRMPADAR